MTYRDMLDTATADLAARLEITEYQVELIGLRDMVRTIYSAASNAYAIAEDTEFAKNIFLLACGQGLVTTCKKLSEALALDLAIKIHQRNDNPFIEVIGDLFND